MEQKIILKENAEKANQAIKNINSFCSKINEVLPEFENENGYQLTVQDIEGLLQSNDHTALIERVDRSIEKGLGAIKVTGVIRKAFMDKTAEFVYSFAKKIQSIKHFYPEISIRDLSFSEGQFNLQNEEKIREDFRVFISTEKEKDLLDKQRAAAESLNDLSMFLKENSGLMNFITIQQFAQSFFSFDSTTKNIASNEDIAYARFLTKPSI